MNRSRQQVGLGATNEYTDPLLGGGGSYGFGGGATYGYAWAITNQEPRVSDFVNWKDRDANPLEPGETPPIYVTPNTPIISATDSPQPTARDRNQANATYAQPSPQAVQVAAAPDAWPIVIIALAFIVGKVFFGH